MANIYAGNPAKVKKIKKHTLQEWSFTLKVELKVIPGQFVMLSLPRAGEVPISISGFSADSIEVTIRNTGKVTSQIFSRVKVGDLLYLRGPYGNGFPLEKFEQQHLLVIAGGSGLAAAKSVIEFYLNQRQVKLNRLDVLAGFKSPQHILFREEINKWQKKYKKDHKYNIEIELTVDTDEDYAWLGSIGFVVNFIKDVKEIGADTQTIVIGPPLMMKNAVRELLQYGVAEQNIWLSFERHMKCGVGKCGHCRIREKCVCTDGPVFNYQESQDLIVL